MIKQVTVFGVAHRLQCAEKRSDNNIDDPAYQALVEQMLKNKDFVFEEASGLGPTLAERLSTKKWGSGRYSDIDPSNETRSKHGIAEQTGSYMEIEPAGISCYTLDCEIVPEQDKRES